MMEDKISSILMKVDPSGFTELLQGERLKRYVVAFTNNVECTTDLLACQARFYWAVFTNLTIGWRTTPQGQIMIDIGTSTDNLHEVFIPECLTPMFRASDPYVDNYGISWALR